MNQENLTTHTIHGEIAGSDVMLRVEGPEAHLLDDDDDRVGSDVIVTMLKRRLSETKQELEAEE